MVATARAAVCVCLWLLSVCAARGSYIPQEMDKAIQNLLRHYKASTRELLTGKPLIPRVLPNVTVEEKMVYMGGVLETYEKLLEHMLREPPTSGPQTVSAASGSAPAVRANPEVRKHLSYLLRMVKLLRTNHYQQQENLLKALQKLRHIQMGDSLIQKRALWELNWLYDEASSLVDEKRMERRRRRKRRQAWQVKGRPRL